ncbi:phosphoribosylanthranilate isomerase [Arenibacter sp. N53]|uniref:phosphoribosylanthranilate isomerase n=1 Tax=Arenibacter TaxID=178469 RepID=UPI000CD44F3B|nr:MULTISPECIES: phosphoribosylanthranilate isomerase [Arenibacter]MCM4153880.1 phosphoribosylanthranilate isomerase [Arenibacter sp. N53]
MKLKVCGMNLNTLEVAALSPDYLGFIFWKPSKRFFEGNIPQLPPTIKKVGVFVDATIEEVLKNIETFGLDAVQLHGKESPEFCRNLKRLNNDRTKAPGAANLKIIKVFSIKDDFDFGVLTPYEEVCDYYLFDTKGKLPGGNGYTFSWEVLKNYPSTKPYFLSGGIGLDEIEKIKQFQHRPESKYCHAIDVNSKFELEPGLKDIDKLKKFIEVMGIE